MSEHKIPLGFSLATAQANFRYQDRNDLGLVIANKPCTAAGVFTKNIFCAAPVVISKKIIAEQNKVRAIIINSGQANACTGENGIQDCIHTLDLVATKFKLDLHEILPASTGIIGDRIDTGKFAEAIPKLQENLGKASAEDFTQAIMTTDAFPKIASKKITIDNKTIQILGMAKGAGMICPNMATMLSVLLCDADIDQEKWQELISSCVDLTFNRVSVDGDTSTNDSVFALASGESKLLITDQNIAALKEAVAEVLATLAYQLVADGEGAKKVLHITVENAKNFDDANKLARTIGHSQLVKTAMYGQDANWGRIVAAAGRANVYFNESELELSIGDILLFKNAMPVAIKEEQELKDLLTKRDIFIRIKLKSGKSSASILCSDLGHEYVDCNASYRS